MLQRRAVIKGKHSLRLVWQNCAARLAKSVTKKKKNTKKQNQKKTPNNNFKPTCAHS